MFLESDKDKILKAKEILASMIYPPGSNPDYSPLHVLCCNDTCSFTWTGAEHINQVINLDLFMVFGFFKMNITIG